MFEATLLQLTIFSLSAMSYAAALVIFTMALSALRFRRLARLDYALYVPAPPLPLMQAPVTGFVPGKPAAVETKAG